MLFEPNKSKRDILDARQTFDTFRTSPAACDSGMHRVKGKLKAALTFNVLGAVTTPEVPRFC